MPREGKAKERRKRDKRRTPTHMRLCSSVCVCGGAEGAERVKKTRSDNRPIPDRSLKTQKTENQPHYFYLLPSLSASLSHVRRFPGILRDLWSPVHALTRSLALHPPPLSIVPFSVLFSSFISFRGSAQPFGCQKAEGICGPRVPFESTNPVDSGS